MNIEQLRPVPTSKVLFNYQGIRQVPGKRGCYVLANFHGEIIYLGVAKNLNERACQHYDNEEKRSVTSVGKAYWLHFVLLADEKTTFQTERGWLNQYELEHGELPPLNKIHSPVS